MPREVRLIGALPGENRSASA